MTDLVELEKVEKSQMEKAVDCLIETQLDVNDFYCITVRKSGVDFQGSYQSEIAKKLLQSDFMHKVNSQGYLEFSNGFTTVTLT
jgi:hypothetical protein